MFGKSRSNFRLLLLLVCFIWASINIGRLFVRSSTFTDFFAWWFAGQYVRQNIDPFTEYTNLTTGNIEQKDNPYVQGENLSFPLDYLDGVEDTQSSIFRLSSVKQIIPANTAPIILIITAFSHFSWPVASQLWMLFNIILGFGVIYLTFYYVEQSGVKITSFMKLLLFLVFLGLDATRSTLQQGQATMLVLFLGLLALYLIDRNHKTWAGIALGIALSRYNVTLPTIFLLLLYRQQFKVIVIAILTQVVALLFIGLWTQTSIFDIFVSYIDIAILTDSGFGSSEVAVYLGAYLEPGTWNTIVLTIVLSLPILSYLVFLLHSPKSNHRLVVLSPENHRLLDIHILSILSLMSLLTVYHLKYDIITIFICLVLFGLVTVDHARWNLSISTKQRFVPFIALTIVPLMISFPLTKLIGNKILGRLVFATQTLSLIILMLASFWLIKMFLSQLLVDTPIDRAS